MTASGRGLWLYVLRHGEPERRDLFYGHHDLDLSERGVAQARAQAECLRSVPFVGIYSSDLRRARRGAEILAEGRGLPVEPDAGLREMSLGALEAMPRVEAHERYPRWAARSYFDMLDARMPGGGESVRDLSRRVLQSVRRMVVTHAGPVTAGRWPSVLLYSHNTVARVLLAEAAGVGVAGYPRFRQRYGAINRIELPRRERGAEGGEVDWSNAAIGFANRDPLTAVSGSR